MTEETVEIEEELETKGEEIGRTRVDKLLIRVRDPKAAHLRPKAASIFMVITTHSRVNRSRQRCYKNEISI